MTGRGVVVEKKRNPGGPAGTAQLSTVDDIEATVVDLRRRGVEFEPVEMPGITVTDGIAEIPGNYPSKGRSERAIWFRDLDGNVLGLGEAVR